MPMLNLWWYICIDSLGEETKPSRIESTVSNTLQQLRWPFHQLYGLADLRSRLNCKVLQTSLADCADQMPCLCMYANELNAVSPNGILGSAITRPMRRRLAFATPDCPDTNLIHGCRWPWNLCRRLSIPGQAEVVRLLLSLAQGLPEA
jgi:hypothetical protein